MNVTVRFLPDDITIEAEPGEAMLEVAQRAGITIPTGCLMGSCHACEVELEDGTSICARISAIPTGSDRMTIHLYTDLGW